MPTIALPFPPTNNNLMTVARGRKIKSARYSSWERDAHAYLLETRQKPKHTPGPYRLLVEVERPDRRSRDLDNLLKAPSDFCKALGMFEDDSLAGEITIRWAHRAGELTKNAVVWITVEPLDR